MTRLPHLRHIAPTLALAALGCLLFAAPALASRPSVTINQASGQADPTATSPIHFTVQFNQAVDGFTANDVLLEGTAGGATSAALVSGGEGSSAYTVAVSGMTSPGTVVASIPEGAAHAGAEQSFASTSADNKVFWQPRPSVTVNQASGQADPTSTSPVEFSVHFSQPVLGFTENDIDLSASTQKTLSAKVVSGTNGDADYTVAVSGMNSTGVVEAKIPEFAAHTAGGYESLPSTSTDNEVNWLHLGHPTVAIDQAASQHDPTSTSPIEFSVHFSQPVTGFEDGDVDTSGSTAGGSLEPHVSGSGADYTVAISGMTTAGTVEARIPAEAAYNVSEEGSLDSTSTDNRVAWEDGPSVTLAPAPGQASPASSAPIVFRAVFAAPVTGFTAAGVDLSNSTAGGTLSAQVSGGPAEYTVEVTGMTSPGRVIASLLDGAGRDSSSRVTAASAPASIEWLPSSAAHPGAGTLKLLTRCRSAKPCRPAKKAKTVPLKFACEGPGACESAVTISYRGPKKHGRRPKPTVLGRATVKLAAGASATVPIRLTKKAKLLLAAGRRLRAMLAIGKTAPVPLFVRLTSN